MKQNLLDLGIDYYAANRIVDGVAMWQKFRRIVNWSSGNTKLKLHVQYCTPTYIFVHNKTQTQTQIYKYYQTHDLRGPGART